MSAVCSQWLAVIGYWLLVTGQAQASRVSHTHIASSTSVSYIHPGISTQHQAEMPSSDKAKLAAAKKAVSLIDDGMKIGIGTGSTAALAVIELGKRIEMESLDIVGTPTSFAAERLAAKHGIPTRPLSSLGKLDFAFDGADEVSPELDLIKGRGAAHTREKVVAASAEQFIVLVDERKMVSHLGEKMPLPVEVLPMAVEYVAGRLKELGGKPELRMGQKKDGPIVTDQGMWILDTMFESIENPSALNIQVSCIPGVLGHGLFVGMATLVLVGSEDGSVREISKP